MLREELPARQRCRMAAGMGVVIVRPGRAIIPVGVIIRAVVTVVMAIRAGVMRVTGALGGDLVAMEMIQCEHAATEPGDHAEHQEP